MTSLLTSCHIPHVCWHYKSVYFIVTCHRQRSTKLSTTYANVSTHAFRPIVDILSILCELGSRAQYGITSSVKIGDNWIKICNLAWIRTCNRCVKNQLKIVNRLWKNEKCQDPSGGGIFLTHTVDISTKNIGDIMSPILVPAWTFVKFNTSLIWWHDRHRTTVRRFFQSDMRTIM